jgi:hypothetical protein
LRSAANIDWRSLIALSMIMKRILTEFVRRIQTSIFSETSFCSWFCECESVSGNRPIKLSVERIWICGIFEENHDLNFAKVASLSFVIIFTFFTRISLSKSYAFGLFVTTALIFLHIYPTADHPVRISENNRTATQRYLIHIFWFSVLQWSIERREDEKLSAL